MSWKVTLPCTRQEAEALHEEDEWLATMDPVPSIVADEVEAFNDAKWRIEVYFAKKPDSSIVALIQSRLPSAAEAKPILAKLPDEDWVVLSQQGLKPVRAGRFYIHTDANKGKVPADTISIHIEASRAFGTGGHETTSGCLTMLDKLKRQGKRYELIADIGTGTGLLAFAACHLWPRAYLTASDIDPVSVDVTAENARLNGYLLGARQGEIALCTASGTDHPLIRQRAPYDLLIANILAGPLIELAPSLAQILGEGGTLMVAGLLDSQACAVVSAYRKLGFRLQRRQNTGDWPCLIFVKRTRYGWQRPLRADGRTSQPPGDFGTW
ncbi:50S ribosomal protein L11 methyltransferase [Sphingorhabdus sp. IMCC26285]|uniref:Ribosomal protein L11 methyltransferase n=1 Tax=Sphingorhabdus profundilacus TaxID=2509718 RepID=A0A6I4LXU6_9SPHN|nr:50S ribosomal protein L11 methyltransferase [Sphingorhabdus profundilacus]MVZ96860.1 50S ribosomal protein L11 methyltransferase [Sphingorhabdus profundilacus]